MGELLLESRGFNIRVADRSDSAALCQLLRDVHIRGELDLIQERDPDFFRLLDLHDGEHEVLIGRGADDRVVGAGAITVRPGWIDGARQPCGYLGDLRVTPGNRLSLLMPRAFAAQLTRARARWGAELFYTVIFDDNLAAKKALVTRSKRRAQLPLYREMTPFYMTNVQMALPCPRPRRRISVGTAADLEPLSEFLLAQSRRRIMGDPLDAERLQRRLDLWPDLTIESFRIARDGGDRIVGCVAPYDADPFKRTRVLGYYGRMRWVRRGLDLGATLLGQRRLPAPGETFRFRFLSHLEVAEEDPAVMNDLLRQVYREARDQRLHFLAAMIPRGSPLEPAFARFLVNRTAMTLYSVTLPDSPYAERDLRTLLPGFEMTLS